MAKTSYKLSYYVFYACIALIAVVLVLFYFVGYDNMMGEYVAPSNTEALIFLMYFLLGVGVLCALGDLVMQLKASPKETFKGLAPLFGTIALLVVTYAVGASNPLLLADGTKYTDVIYLKLSDACIYTSYILAGLALLGVVVNLVKGGLNK